MHKITLDEAQEQLPALLNEVAEGGTVVIERGDGATFQIVPSAEVIPRPRQFGILKGKIRMSDDFDDPLPEFEPYR